MIRSDKYLDKICMEIYRKMYKEATPSVDLDELIKKGVTKKEGWFMDYYLDEERQVEIIDEICKKYKCNKWERNKIENSIWLGASPTSIKKK